jgi:hypothetical protein
MTNDRPGMPCLAASPCAGAQGVILQSSTGLSISITFPSVVNTLIFYFGWSLFPSLAITEQVHVAKAAVPRANEFLKKFRRLL